MSYQSDQITLERTLNNLMQQAPYQTFRQMKSAKKALTHFEAHVSHACQNHAETCKNLEAKAFIAECFLYRFSLLEAHKKPLHFLYTGRTKWPLITLHHALQIRHSFQHIWELRPQTQAFEAPILSLLLTDAYQACISSWLKETQSTQTDCLATVSQHAGKVIDTKDRLSFRMQALHLLTSQSINWKHMASFLQHLLKK